MKVGSICYQKSTKKVSLGDQFAAHAIIPQQTSANLLKQYVPKTKSYVRDTQHFIKRIRDMGPLPEGTKLVTLDVSSLYTNIPNHEGIQAVAHHIRSDISKQKIGPFLIRLIKLVLHSMNFEFNGDHYL